MRQGESDANMYFVSSALSIGPEHRDARGRLVKGHPGGPGRPKATDLRACWREYARKHNTTPEAAMGRVLGSMFRRAIDGDVAAARLLIDELCVRPDDVARGSSGGVTIVLHTGVPDPIDPPTAARIVVEEGEGIDPASLLASPVADSDCAAP